MKNDKFYKFLRIVFLTLAIVSIVFTLAKKTGLCASGGTGNFIYTKYPLPVGEGWGYGGQLTGEIVSDMISEALASYPDMKLLTVPMVWDSNEMSVNVYTSLSSINFSGDINDLDNPSSITYSGGGVGLDYRVNLGGYTGMEYSMGTGPCVPSNYVTQGPTGGDVYLISNVYIPQYPLYISPDVDPSVYNLYFTLGDDSGGDATSIVISGHSTGSTIEGLIETDPQTGAIIGFSGQSTGGTFELAIEGLDGALLGIQEEIEGQGFAIQDKLDSIEDEIYIQGHTIGGKLDTLNGKIDTLNGNISQVLSGWEKVKSFFAWLHDHGLDNNGHFSLIELFKYLYVPSRSDMEDALQDSVFYSDIQAYLDVVQDYTDMIEETEANSSYYWEFNFSSDIVNSNSPLAKTGNFRVYFDFWQYIRDRFWKYFTYFFVFGNILLILRKIPSILNGISSSGDAE